MNIIKVFEEIFRPYLLEIVDLIYKVKLEVDINEIFKEIRAFFMN